MYRFLFDACVWMLAGMLSIDAAIGFGFHVISKLCDLSHKQVRIVKAKEVQKIRPRRQLGPPVGQEENPISISDLGGTVSRITQTHPWQNRDWSLGQIEIVPGPNRPFPAQLHIKFAILSCLSPPRVGFVPVRIVLGGPSENCFCVCVYWFFSTR